MPCMKTHFLSDYSNLTQSSSVPSLMEDNFKVSQNHSTTLELRLKKCSDNFQLLLQDLKVPFIHKYAISCYLH